MKLSHVPLRLATGAFILNAGLGKRGLPAEAAAGLQGMAANATPKVKQLEPQTFGRTLANTEIALGGALLTPFVPATLAGAGLTAFSGGLLAMYLRTPGMREPGTIKPTQEGTSIAKDVWLLGAGLSLLLDGLAERRRRKSA